MHPRPIKVKTTDKYYTLSKIISSKIENREEEVAIKHNINENMPEYTKSGTKKFVFSY